MAQLLRLHHLVGRIDELRAVRGFLSGEVQAQRDAQSASENVSPETPEASSPRVSRARGGCMIVTGQAGVGKHVCANSVAC